MDTQVFANLTTWQITLLAWAGATIIVCAGIWWAAEHAPYEFELWPHLRHGNGTD